MNIGKGSKKKEREREANHKRLLTIEKKLRVSGGEVGGGWAQWVMGIKEGTCCDEHQVLYGSIKSLTCTPEINITLYVN